MINGFGAVCCVYEDDAWLPMMIESCYPVVDKMFCLVGLRPWFGTAGSNKATLAAIRSAPDPDNKIVIIEDDRPTEAAQRNYGLSLCRAANLNFCFVVDADEIYDTSALATMMAVVSMQDGVDAWYIPHITYWKTYRHIIDGMTTNQQTGFIRVGQSTFSSCRNTNATRVVSLPGALGVCHHLSYARTDEQVLSKLQHFSHANRIRPDWFENVWLKWDANPAMRHLHPIVPEVFPCAVRQEVDSYPSVLRRIYERSKAGEPTHESNDCSPPPHLNPDRP